MDTSKIMIEQVDVLSEVEILNKKMRDVAIKGCTEEQIKAYDIGVKNTMSALSAVISILDQETDRIIYQKYGETSFTIRYVRLSDVLNELEKSGKIKFSEGD